MRYRQMRWTLGSACLAVPTYIASRVSSGCFFARHANGDAPYGTKRRKTMSARMSAIRGTSGLVLLTLSFSHFGRVEMWRGGCRSDISVPAPFVWRCLNGSTVTPFPHPAHRTGRADFPHPALGQDLTPLTLACDAICSF